MSNLIQRRTFFSAAAAFTAASYSRILGANEKVNMGLIGCGGRGRGVLRNFVANPNVNATALCDVFSARIDEAAQIAPNAKGYKAHEDLLAANDVDAVLIATPDHWHAGTCVDAANAGKDIYCEKPLTLRIEEGPQIVKAVRLNERVCQVGMQQRSGKHYLMAKEKFFDSGKIGKVTLARTWWHGNGAHLRPFPEQYAKQPSNLDWGRFLGPVSWREYDPKQYFNFRAYLEYGGGQITDLFTHWIDAVHLFMSQDDPVAAVASGGIYHYKDGRTAPDTINCLLDYRGEWTATFEGTLAPGLRGAGVEVIGTEGRLWITRGRYEWYLPRQDEPAEVQEAIGNMTQDHVDNFIDCVKSRERPNGDVWVGHRSAQASHLGNIAYLQKRRLKFDPDREEILPL
ncbi:MAG: Gfo/Idh/MocA family oxidoreductase [Bryobacterales bacterium]|nr:Gfo/Idh/MocA family oxidoreductase [Bryobacterales bacterium]MDE0264716.1 Gfo/Idh/MocA family oxidoreductase [Bryobacterales bacterium]MDE0624150.1 Gfo/Idh/MocA family oxidoreductase [Bryobacterales bacterium]